MRAPTYADYLAGQGMAPRTVREYVREVQGAIDWLSRRGCSLSDATPTALREYAATRPNTPSIRSHLRAGVIWWWRWQDIEGWPYAIEVPKQKPMVCQALEPDDMVLVAKAARGWWRAGTCVLIALTLGLRNEELRTLRWENFDRDMEWAEITGKGNKVRTVAVPPLLAREAGPYREAGYVFKGRFGGYVSHQTINNWVKAVCGEAGLTEEVWPHRLRHTFGAEANDTTGDLRAVARAMGHARTATTEGYTRTTAAALRRVSNAVADRIV